MEITEVKVRTDIHLARRIYHSLGICVILVLYRLMDRSSMLILFSSFTVVCGGLDIARLKIPFLNQLFTSFFRPFIRKNELQGLTGMSFVCLGVLTVVTVFPPEVAKLSLLMLAFGDPVSSIVGIQYGKDKLIGNKSLQGTLAGFVTCGILSGAYFLSLDLFSERIILISLLSGIIGAISELIPVLDLDDNFTFPIISSILIWSLFRLLGT